MQRHDTGVLNQFKFDGENGRRACLPLCIQAIYQLHIMLNEYDELPTTKEWASLMYRGIRVWQLWRERNPKCDTLFPLVDEIITMPECKEFYEYFNIRCDEFGGPMLEECGGLVFNSKVIENTEGPLSRVVTSLLKAKKESCAIITLPNHHNIALLRYCSSLFLFDSHGRRGSDQIDFVQFNNSQSLIIYLKTEHSLINIDNAILPDSMSKLEICNQFSYSATVFTTTK